MHTLRDLHAAGPSLEQFPESPASFAAEDTKDSKEQHEDKKAKTETGSEPTKTEQHVDKKPKTEDNNKSTEATPAADPTEPLAEGKPKNVVEEGRIYFFYRYHCSSASCLSAACPAVQPPCFATHCLISSV